MGQEKTKYDCNTCGDLKASMELNKIYLGDCKEVLKTFPENSVDSVITDCPYGLGFMGKEWDTFDKTQFGIAGKEGANDLKVKKNFNVMPRYNTDGLYEFTKEWAQEALRVAKPGAFMLCFTGSRTYHKIVSGIEDAGWEIRDCIMWIYGSGFPKNLDISKAIDKSKNAERKVIGVKNNTYDGCVRNPENHKSPAELSNIGKWGLTQTPHGMPLTEPATDLAKEWNGWGTSLKPAFEPIVVAMKPIEKNFAHNAEKWGVAGVNLDGCRIELNGDYKCKANGRPSLTGLGDNYDSENANEADEIGRWPANIIFDEDAAKVLDEQTGGKPKAKETMGVWPPDNGVGASRFFYCAKASKSEKGQDNNHPTVKPVALMRYLCRLLKTSKGGIVLDPFMGSGTTAVACIKEKRTFVGIEREKDYLKIAESRVKRALDNQEDDIFGN